MAAPAPIQYPLDVAGRTARVLQWGSAGPLVLFLHGLGSHAEIWSRVAPALAAEGRRCIAVDLPGHGLSSKDGDFAYTLAGHVAWLAALTDTLGEARIDLVGSSLGGLWAAGFATRHPARVRCVTLIGAIGLAPLTLERRRWTANNLAHMDRDSIEARLRASVFDPAGIEESFIEESFRMNSSRGAAAAFAALGRYYLGPLNEDLQLEALRELGRDCPLLLVWGLDDETVPYAVAREAASVIAGSTLLSLQRTRHIPHLERPASVHWALARHLSGAGVPRGPIEGGEAQQYYSQTPDRIPT